MLVEKVTDFVVATGTGVDVVVVIAAVAMVVVETVVVVSIGMVGVVGVTDVVGSLCVSVRCISSNSSSNSLFVLSSSVGRCELRRPFLTPNSGGEPANEPLIFLFACSL